MALRYYILNLVSDCAQTNGTNAAKMSVTIVSDNSVPYIQNDASIAASIAASGIGIWRTHFAPEGMTLMESNDDEIHTKAPIPPNAQRIVHVHQTS